MHSLHPLRRLLPLLAMLVAAFAMGSGLARAQCDPQWLAGEAPPTASGAVHGMATWDPDGAGPLGSVLVAVGATWGFGATTAKVRLFDGTRWTFLVDPPGSYATSVVSWNGQLIVATDVGVHQWTGSNWSSSGPADVRSMIVWNGLLYVGGSFTVAGGVAANRVARWDGSTWSALGAGVNGTVLAFASFQGVLYVGGTFSSAGGAAAGNLAIWNGSSWVATAATNGTVSALVTRIGTALTNSFLFAGGSFTTIAGTAANHVARFSPATNSWSALGAGLSGTGCNALFVRSTGLSSYELTGAIPDQFSNQMLRWDGATSTWVGMGAPPGGGSSAEVLCIALWSGSYVLGRFTTSGVAVHRLGTTTWEPLLGSGIDGTVNAVLADGAETIVGGRFVQISGMTVNGIARGHSGAWLTLGGGVTGPGVNSVNALTRLPNGDLIAGGAFRFAGGLAANNIARWNGSSWSSLGSGTSGPVSALAVLPNGDLVAAGQFLNAGGGLVNHIARWNGSSWTSVGVGCNSQVLALAVTATGDLVAGGAFTNQGNHVARWNGSTWSSMGSGLANAVWALASLPNGDVVASGTAVAGSPTLAARWDGTTWGPVESQPPALPFYPNALKTLLDGSLVAVGSSASNAETASRLVGGVWTPLGITTSPILAVDQGTDGVLRIGGDFDGDGSVAAARFALRSVPCPALAATVGAGCASSGGSNTLTAATLPWVNSTFRARGTGLPTLAVVLAVTSVTPAVPPVALSALLPQGVPGCNLHVVPDILEAIVTTNGAAESVLQLPNAPAIVGATFHHQMIPIEIDGLGAWTAITATNSLQLTAGIF